MKEFQYTHIFKEDLANMCDPYCESMNDREFNFLIDGLNDKLKNYFRTKLELLMG